MRLGRKSPMAAASSAVGAPSGTRGSVQRKPLSLALERRAWGYGAGRHFLRRLAIDKRSGIPEHTGMPDHTAPDYPLEDLLLLESPAQYRALFDDTRLAIIELLSERAATTSQLAEALGRPKGTIGHHIGVLAEAGLIRVVRTEKVRAIEAKYYGRTARTFDLRSVEMTQAGVTPESLLTRAADEVAAGKTRFADRELPAGTSVRYARIPEDRAAEFADRLDVLLTDFVSTPRGGEIVYGLAVALYPTARPHLPDPEGT